MASVRIDEREVRLVLFHGSGEPMLMTYLSEDPTILAGGALVLAGAFLIALRVTQQGKYLIYAGTLLGLALVVVIVEWLWVTDSERIEKVVYDLRRAVVESDVDGVLAHLSPHVQYSRGDLTLPEEATRSLIQSNLGNSRFDFVRISGLQTSASTQARRGRAEFRVFARGSLNTALTTVDGGSATTDWSLGFQETEPGIWKVCRITPISLPYGALMVPDSSPRRGRFPRIGMTKPGPGGSPDTLSHDRQEGMPRGALLDSEAN
jgi:hypothetical protein